MIVGFLKGFWRFDSSETHLHCSVKKALKVKLIHCTVSEMFVNETIADE